MQNGYFIKIIKISRISKIGTIRILKFFNDFNKVIILHLWFLFIMYGFGYFYFYTNGILIMIFSTRYFFLYFFLYFSSISIDDMIPPWGCYLINQATLVFTPFEICKHPIFAQSLIYDVLELPNQTLKWINYIKTR